MFSGRQLAQWHLLPQRQPSSSLLEAAEGKKIILVEKCKGNVLSQAFNLYEIMAAGQLCSALYCLILSVFCLAQKG